MPSALRKRAPLRPSTPAIPTRRRAMHILVAFAAGAAAFSSVAYELLLASYATFLLGASVFQYSLVFSLMMASMGLGALVAGRFKDHAVDTLLAIEVGLALCACSAIPVLYTLFAIGGPAQSALLAFVFAMGFGLGMEVPLLNDLERGNRWLNDILFYDYIGGFIGGLLFPLWLLPQLGFFRLAALLGCLNAALAFGFVWVLRPRNRLFWLACAGFALKTALASLLLAETLRSWMEKTYFGIPS